MGRDDPRRVCEATPAPSGREARFSCVRYLCDRFLLASVVIRNGGILCWDLDALEPRPVAVVRPGVVRPIAEQPLRCLDVSPDGLFVATGGDDCVVGVLRVVRRAGQPELEALWGEKQSAPVYAVTFANHDGTLILASADRRGEVRLWNAETGETRGVLRDGSKNEEDWILSLEFSSDGRRLAAAQRGGNVLLWDMDRPRELLQRNRECAEQLRRLHGEPR